MVKLFVIWNMWKDSTAETDMNVVMMEDGRMIEVQGTAEGEPLAMKNY